jgi:hypothetical protein
MWSVALLVSAAFSPSALAVLGHSANGTGTSTQNGGSSFDFTAAGGPGATGGGATGSMTYQDLSGTAVQAEVRCLFVSGNRAKVVGLVVASTIPPPTGGSVGTHMVFNVEDNGTPGAGIDEWTASFGGADETDCVDIIDFNNPILTGEILVQAVEPPPACPPDDDDDQADNDNPGEDDGGTCPDDQDDDNQGEDQAPGVN